MKTTLHRVQVALDFAKMSASDLATFADGVATGLTDNPDFPSPPVSPATITQQTTQLRVTLTLVSAGNRTPEVTRRQHSQAGTLMRSLAADAHYVEDTSNATPSVGLEKTEEMILGTGFKLKKKGARPPRTFEVVETGPSWVHVRARKAGGKKAEAHLWRYGLTPAKGTPPTTMITRVTLESEVLLTDLASNTVIGIQHASVLPVTHTAKTSATAPQGSTALPANKARHPILSHMESDPYTWGDFIYVVVP